MLDALTLLSGFIALAIAALVLALDTYAAHRTMQSTMKHMLGGRDNG